MKSVKIYHRTIVFLSLVLMLSGLIVFFLTWCKPWIGLPASVVLLVGAIAFYQKEYAKRQDTLELPIWVCFAAVGIALLWAAFSGNCGIGVSHHDTSARTALFRDLVNYDWPVLYPESNSALVYYIFFWLVPALVGKAFGFQVAQGVLLLWVSMTTVLVFFLVAHLLPKLSGKRFTLMILILICWGGINIIGAAIMQSVGYYSIGLYANDNFCDQLYNGESFNFFYRTNTNFYEEPYNQIFAWLVIPLVLDHPKTRNFAFLGLLLFPYSPWSVIGLMPAFIVFALQDLFPNFVCRNFKKIFRETFSIPNLCAIGSIFPVVCLYLMSSNASRRGMGNSTGHGFGLLTFSKFDKIRIFALVLFWIVQFGIYWFTVFPKHKHKPLFYVLLLWLMFCPIAWIATIGGRDCCMNCSVPMLFILMIYVMQYVFEDVLDHVLTIRGGILLICLTLAALSPVMVVLSRLGTMKQNKSLIVQDDSIYSFATRDPNLSTNFLSATYQSSPFYQYIAR